MEGNAQEGEGGGTLLGRIGARGGMETKVSTVEGFSKGKRLMGSRK